MTAEQLEKDVAEAIRNNMVYKVSAQEAKIFAAAAIEVAIAAAAQACVEFNDNSPYSSRAQAVRALAEKK